MSELIITPKSKEEITYYYSADSYLIGNASFCVRYNYSYSLLEIKECKELTSKLNKKLYINVNKIFQELELDRLKDYLLYLKELNVDGIFFSDYAVYQIAKEINIVDKCIFYHETYPLNSYDLEVLKSLDLKGVIMSKEVEITTLRKVSKYSNIGMIAFGHLEIFNSKRKLIETYEKQYNLKNSLVNNYEVSVKEMTRDTFYPLYQDENGTNIFTDFVYSSLKDFKELHSLKMEFFIIDTIFLDKEYSLSVLNLFNDLRNDKDVDLEKFYVNSKYHLGSGFLHLDVGLIK